MVNSHDPEPITAKDRKILTQVDKALALFDALEEWADYVSFLSKLQKALHFMDDSRRDQRVPRASIVANKLSLCLLPNLPNGVHQKALAIYEHIFSVMLQDTFTREASLWLPGLLPLLSYCSMQLKPQLIALFRDSVFSLLSPQATQSLTKPLVLALMLGLDDENAETFPDALSLMDSLRNKVNNDSFFWLNIFLCIIRNPERRLGALQWCTRRLPLLGPGPLSEDARACLSPEPGLFVRAFASALSGFPVSLSSEIIIVRGFFDMLLSHAPLHSVFYDELVSPKDKDLIIMAAARVSLRKDMGLNRRLWLFLLGNDGSGDLATSKSDPVDYFETFALEYLLRGLKVLADDDSRLQESIKISLAITFEKWEISKHITPPLFVMFLEKCYSQQGDTRLIKTALAFFDSVEPVLVWRYVVGLIKKEHLDLVLFLVTNFDFNYDEVTTTHVPMAVLCVLCGNINKDSIKLFEVLIEIVSPRIWKSSLGDECEYLKSLVVESIDKYYENNVSGDNVRPPPELQNFQKIVVNLLCDAYATCISNPELSPLLAKHLALTLEKTGVEGLEWENSSLTLALKLFHNSEMASIQTVRDRTVIALGVVKIITIKRDILDIHNIKCLIKRIIGDLWDSIYAGFPGYYQIEAVKAILDLHSAFLPYYVQAGVIEHFKKVPVCGKPQVFSALWGQAHTSDTNMAILEQPLQILLDSVDPVKQVNTFALSEFVEACLKDTSSGRLMKLLISSFLEFGFLTSGCQCLTNDDDLARFAYHLGNLATVINTAPNNMVRFLKNQPIDETFLKISGSLSVVSYKSIMISMCLKILELELDPDFTLHDSNLWTYLKCLNEATCLIKSLITGSERKLVQQFTIVVESVMYWIQVKGGNPEVKELIVCKLLELASFYLDLAESHNIELYVNEQEHHSYADYFGRLFTLGMSWTQTNVLLAQWKLFLTKSLQLLSDRVFQVLEVLDDAILLKLNGIVESLWQGSASLEVDDLDGAISILLSCLEDLLLTSHGYSGSSRKGSRGEKSSLDGGFFGNVIQGVFLIEAPASAQLESAKSQSVLTSFQNAVYTSFRIWMWGDARSLAAAASVSPGEPNKECGEASLTNLAHKLRFRSRRLLETLMGVEKQQVLETLIKLDPSHTSSCKLVTIIDGGRYQVSLSKVFDSIVSRCAPELLDEKRVSSLSVEINVLSLSGYMLYYLEKMDSDSIGDVWGTCIQYMRDVATHPSQFCLVLYDCMKLGRMMATKVVANKSPEKHKFQKELTDEFLRLLTAVLNCPETKTDIQEAVSKKDSSSKPIESLLFDTLNMIVPDLGLINEDHEKVVSCLNVIITYTLVPIAKVCKPSEYPSYVIKLITAIGKVHQGKQWKSIVSDSFFDSLFLEGEVTKLSLWNEPLLLWIESDKERFVELINKATTNTVSTGGLFRNEAAEVQAKVSAIKRLTFLIMNGPQNQFLSQVETIFARIDHSLRGTPSPLFRGQVLTLFRALTLKFDAMFLLSYWAFIAQEIVSALNIAVEAQAKPKPDLTHDQVILVLSASKLLDQLLILGYDDFNLNEWLFTSSSADAMSHTLKEKSSALVDRISFTRTHASQRADPVRIDTPTGDLEPLLKGVKQIGDVSELRLFFDNLSWINFERVFGMCHVNRESCEEDVLNDLF